MTNTLNQVCAGGSVDADVGASWMYNLYTFISGGAGQTTSPWLIMSASNASSVTTAWTGSGDVTWNRTGSAHSWFVARNDVGATETTTNATIYFSTSRNRWILEAPDI